MKYMRAAWIGKEAAPEVVIRCATLLEKLEPG
jgi:hypothetical protein